MEFNEGFDPGSLAGTMKVLRIMLYPHRWSACKQVFGSWSNNFANLREKDDGLVIVIGYSSELTQAFHISTNGAEKSKMLMSLVRNCVPAVPMYFKCFKKLRTLVVH